MKLEEHLNMERCPHCAIFKPNLFQVTDYLITRKGDGTNERRWRIYRCSNCGGLVSAYSLTNDINVIKYFPSINIETFDGMEYLENDVKNDFEEALKCYSNQCFNAFASMCRRTIQSSSNKLGAEGKDRVKKQINELKEIAGIEDDTYEVLEQIIIAGHDGAHPHLPKLSPERAAILLVLMKDVLNELFVRKAIVKKAMELRRKDVKNNKTQKN